MKRRTAIAAIVSAPVVLTRPPMLPPKIGIIVVNGQLPQDVIDKMKIFIAQATRDPNQWTKPVVVDWDSSLTKKQRDRFVKLLTESVTI